jgi:hypothetical protein
VAESSASLLSNGIARRIRSPGSAVVVIAKAREPDIKISPEASSKSSGENMM